MFKKNTKIISIDVSSICYARCIYCLHQRQKMIAPRNLTLNKAGKLLDIISAEKFGTVIMTLTGEAFSNPSIYGILSGIGKRGMDAIVVTKLFTYINFPALTDVIKNFREKDKSLGFGITIDSLSSATTRLISPGIRSSTVRYNILKAHILQTEFPNFNLSFQTVVCKHNENELNEIKAWLKATGFDSWVPKQLQYYMSSLASKEETALIEDAYPSDEKYQKRFGWENGKIISKLTHCPSLNPAISLSGDLLICCMDMLIKHPIGNVLTSGSIRSLLKSDKFQEMSALADRRELSICKDCN